MKPNVGLPYLAKSTVAAEAKSAIFVLKINNRVAIFEYAHRHEKLTWRKSPLCTMSEWWRDEWGMDKVAYTLMDAEAMAMSIRKLRSEVEINIADYSIGFPQRRCQTGRAPVAYLPPSFCGRSIRKDSVTEKIHR